MSQKPSTFAGGSAHQWAAGTGANGLEARLPTPNGPTAARQAAHQQSAARLSGMLLALLLSCCGYGNTVVTVTVFVMLLMSEHHKTLMHACTVGITVTIYCHGFWVFGF